MEQSAGLPRARRRRAPSRPLPGMAQAAAEKALADVGLAVALQTAPSGDGAPGAVISQSPESGNAVDAGTLVTLLVPADTPIAVPNVVGMTQASAEKLSLIHI